MRALVLIPLAVALSGCGYPCGYWAERLAYVKETIARCQRTTGCVVTAENIEVVQFYERRTARHCGRTP